MEGMKVRSKERPAELIRANTSITSSFGLLFTASWEGRHACVRFQDFEFLWSDSDVIDIGLKAKTPTVSACLKNTKTRTFAYSENTLNEFQRSRRKQCKNICVIGDCAEIISASQEKTQKEYTRCRRIRGKNISVFSYNANRQQFVHTSAIF